MRFKVLRTKKNFQKTFCFLFNSTGLSEKKTKILVQMKIGIANCVGRSTGSMVGNYCFGLTFLPK